MQKYSNCQEKYYRFKISEYKYQRIITLYPVKDEIKLITSEVPILAAASPEKEPQVKTQTFVDEEKGIVIRLVRIKDTAKIYVFPVNPLGNSKISLVLQPGNIKYTIANISSPLEVENLPDVESISLKTE